jgi:hypothetical protein
LAQDVPPHYKASPDVYKLISENDKFRVIKATWKPGLRDLWHSHSGAETAYRLTDCQSRIYTPDGESQDGTGKLEEVDVNPMIVSRSFENVGTTECKALIVERK